MRINIKLLSFMLLLIVIFVSCTANNGSSDKNNTENQLPDKNLENEEQDSSTAITSCCEEKGLIIFDTSEDLHNFFEKLSIFEGKEFLYEDGNLQVVLSKHVVDKILELKIQTTVPFTTKEITENSQFMRVGVSWNCSNNEYSLISGLCEFYRLSCFFCTFAEIPTDIESVDSLQNIIDERASDPDSLKLTLGGREVYLKKEQLYNGAELYIGYLVLDGYYSRILVHQYAFEALSDVEYLWYSIDELDFEYDKSWRKAD